MGEQKTDVSKVSMTQLAELTGRGPEQISKLIRQAGLLPVLKDGRTMWFVPRLALPIIYEIGKGISLDAERARLAREQADATAMKNAVTRGELMSQAEVEATVVAMGAILREGVLALVAKLPPALDGATTIVEREAIVRGQAHELLDEIAAFGRTLAGASKRSVEPDARGGVSGGEPPAEPNGKPVGRSGARPKPRVKPRAGQVADQPS